MSDSTVAVDPVRQAYDVWHTQIRERFNERVFGVVLGKNGDSMFTLQVDGAVELITQAGWCARPLRASEYDVIEKAMKEDRFQIVAGRSVEGLLLRIYPGLKPNWSKKSAHPCIGGLGMVSAVGPTGIVGIH